MKRNELYEKAKEAELKTYKRIQSVVLISGLLLLIFVHWRIGLVGCVWFIWNDIWFEVGNREHLAKEYETGYIPRGLKKMFKSWPFYFLFAAVMLWVAYRIPFPLHQW